MQVEVYPTYATSRRSGAAETDDSPEFRELMGEYLTSLPGVVNQLRAAVTRRNYETVAAIGHNLKGSGGTLGFPELTEIATRLEVAAKKRLDEAIRSAVDELAAFVEPLPLGRC